MEIIDVTGTYVGKWIILKQAFKKLAKTNEKIVLCKCTECGITEKWLYYHTVKRNDFKMCNTCVRKIVGKKYAKHGMKNTPEYKTWCSMKGRCYNTNAKEFKYYGAKGVTVSDEWKNSFMTFYKDMGKRKDGYSIERIDVFKGYSKDNCIWIPRKDQNENRRGSVRILHNGVTKSLTKACRDAGISMQKVRWASGYDKSKYQQNFDIICGIICKDNENTLSQ